MQFLDVRLAHAGSGGHAVRCVFSPFSLSDFMLDLMEARVNFRLVMSTYHLHKGLMSTAKGERSHTLTPTHTHTEPCHVHRNRRTYTCPGGPIFLSCDKPAHLLENQSCSAPGPVNSGNLE